MASQRSARKLVATHAAVITRSLGAIQGNIGRMDTPKTLCQWAERLRQRKTERGGVAERQRQRKRWKNKGVRPSVSPSIPYESTLSVR